MVVNGTSNVVNYGTCSTAATTAAKVVSCSSFALITGAEITVKFTTANTAANPTLNVNNTGAKAIYYRGSAISKSYLAANRTYTFRYNGSQYDLVGDINTDTNTKVTQTLTTSDASYPLLLAPSGQTATTTTTSYFDSEVSLNPSTNTIAANISGNAATADTAQKAVEDNKGNTIDSFYLPLSAGQDKKLIGPLGLTENVNYGTSLPDNGFVGQLFFLEDSSETVKTIQIDLASNSAASFDGSENITPGVTGTLPIANGGTGATTASDARINLGAVNMVTKTITLFASNWSSNTQIVNVTDVTSSNTILVSYNPESYEAYSDAVIRCVGQNNGTLTFSCDSIPSIDVFVNVVILN